MQIVAPGSSCSFFICRSLSLILVLNVIQWSFWNVLKWKTAMWSTTLRNLIPQIWPSLNWKIWRKKLILWYVIITTRACARGKAIGFVCLSSVCRLSVVIVVTKIARSGHLDIWETCRYNETVEMGKKLALLCFELLGKAHECHKYCVFIDHTYWLLCWPCMCFLLMRTPIVIRR